jgi:hypothetical protein
MKGAFGNEGALRFLRAKLPVNDQL